MKYGIIVGNKPIQNKRPDGTKGSTGNASIEYKEDEPIVIGKAADGRVMKQVHITIATPEYEDKKLIIRDKSQEAISTFDIIDVSGCLKFRSSMHLPLKSTLDDLTYNYTISSTLNTCFTQLKTENTQKDIWLNSPVYKLAYMSNLYENDVSINLDICMPALQQIRDKAYVAREHEQITPIGYKNINNLLGVIAADLCAHLTITYLVKE